MSPALRDDTYGRPKPRLVDDATGPGGVALLLASVVSGALLGLAMWVPNARGLVWVGLVPFGWQLRSSTWSGVAYSAGLLGAAMLHAVGLAWMLMCYDGVASPVWFFCTVGCALCWVPVLAAGRAADRRSPWCMAIGLPLAWVSFEYLRSVLFRLVDGNGFPLLWLGLPMADHSCLSQTADIWGVAGLSWLVAMVNGAILDVTTMAVSRGARPGRLLAVKTAGIVAVFLLAACVYGQWRLGHALDRPGPMMALVTGAVSEHTTLPATTDQREQAPVAVTPIGKPLDGGGATAGPSTVDVYVWPETSFSGQIGGVLSKEPLPATRLTRPTQQDAGTLRTVANSLGAPMVVGVRRVEQVSRHAQRRFNSAAYVLPGKGLDGLYDKRHRVAFLEFTPWWMDLLGCSLADAVPLPDIGKTEFAEGRRADTFPVHSTRTGRSYRIAATICYDVCFPDIHREYMNGKPDGPPDVFVCLMNESLDRGGVISRLTMRHTRLRAIECRRPYCRVSEGGVSAIIDSSGRVLQQRCQGGLWGGVLIGQVPVDLRRSVYVACGDWLPVICCIVFVGRCLLRRFAKCRPLRDASATKRPSWQGRP